MAAHTAVLREVAGAAPATAPGPAAPDERGVAAGIPGGFAAWLGTRVAALQWSDLPPEAVRWAGVGILDTVGVTLAGSREEAPRLAARALDLAAGPALVLGARRRVGTLDAAYVNGTSSHVLDFDDCNNTLGGHPSAPVLSALFPLADELGASGRDFVLAYVAGFEVETKLALAVNFHHYTKGWHPTATLGTFGAAAACAKLMGLDAHATTVALALAASFASGLKANFGTMAKPMHVGHAARSGVLAARLARAGFTANTQDVFEHDQGFLNVFNGPGTFDTARAVAAWAAPLDIVRPGIAIKQYPCCGSTHPAIDAMLDLVAQRRIAADDVARIDAWIHPRRLKHTNRPAPGSRLDAKFSLQYVLARALLDGHVGVADFEGDRFRDAEVQALLPRVHVAPYDDTRFPADNHFGGAVRITLRDGTVAESRVEQALGRTSANPVPPERLRAKFALCAATVLGAECVDAVADAIANVAALADMRTLTQLVMTGTVAQDMLPVKEAQHSYDVVVLGKGNAALCAALAAREQGGRVAMLEAAPQDESGGNSRFAGGVMRFAYSSVDDLKRVTDLTDAEVAQSDFGTNTADEFFDDLFRLTSFRTDPTLSEMLVTQSLDTMAWLRTKGVKFVPNFGRQSALVDGRRKFFGRMPIEASGGGAGLVQSLDAAAQREGIDVFYGTRAKRLIEDGGRVVGVHASRDGAPADFLAKSVVMACGGFEANPEMRTRYLGTGWELAKVRGSRFNQGDGLKMALDIGAAPYGNWSGCHATGWDMNAPEFGDVSVGDQFQKHSYIFGLLINANGRRFVDEGLDFHSFTYAKYGGEVLKQPGQFAWQVFDAKVAKLLRSEYRIKMMTKVTANTLEDLAGKLEGVDPRAFLETVKAFNASVRTDVPFDHTVKDGRGTTGIEPPKSNWAQALDTPPFDAYGTTCGITFTFGGLRIDPASGQVLDVTLRPIPGLYCAGEMVGGLFYFNYPSGTGLVSGALFGRLAGTGAATAAAAAQGAVESTPA